MLDLTQSNDAHIDQRLRSEPIIWLSTVRPDGRPHIVPVWFFWDGTNILIFSMPNTQKLRNLRQNSNVMLALDNTNRGGDVVMLEGKAELLAEKTEGMATPAFLEKYDSFVKRMGTDPQTLAAAYSEAIRITPTKFC